MLTACFLLLKGYIVVWRIINRVDQQKLVMNIYGCTVIGGVLIPVEFRPVI